jgi:hypothetical protein
VRVEGPAKRAKDLAQSRELIDALASSAPHSIGDALADASRRGRKWRTHIERSLREIGRAHLAGR